MVAFLNQKEVNEFLNKESNIIKIEGIKNYYGSLCVKKEAGKYYMDVKCELYGYKWREIKKELYNMLIELNKCKYLK